MQVIINNNMADEFWLNTELHSASSFLGKLIKSIFAVLYLWCCNSSVYQMCHDLACEPAHCWGLAHEWLIPSPFPNPLPFSALSLVGETPVESWLTG